MGLLIRSEFDFTDAEGSPNHTKCRLDLMRELGALLHLAQQRHREGKTDPTKSSSQWWTTTPRWGGGPGGCFAGEECEAYNATYSSSSSASSASHTHTPHQKRSKDLAAQWRTLKPNPSSWDAKTTYRRFGPSSDEEYDHVYLLSALNHHVSLLRLKVSRHYLDLLETGVVPANATAEQLRPVLNRTRWWDLFVVEDRVEAFCALWGVVGFCMRERGRSDACTCVRVEAMDIDVRICTAGLQSRRRWR